MGLTTPVSLASGVMLLHCLPTTENNSLIYVFHCPQRLSRDSEFSVQDALVTEESDRLPHITVPPSQQFTRWWQKQTLTPSTQVETRLNANRFTNSTFWKLVSHPCTILFLNCLHVTGVSILPDHGLFSPPPPQS